MSFESGPDQCSKLVSYKKIKVRGTQCDRVLDEFRELDERELGDLDCILKNAEVSTAFL